MADQFAGVFLLIGHNMDDAREIAPNAPHTVELISTQEGVAGLEDDWNRLSACAESPNVFMTYSWFRAWTKQLIR